MSTKLVKTIYFKNNKPVSFLLLTGFLVGTLDILAAFLDVYLTSDKGPDVVLRYIASGVFGRAAFTGNNSMIAWGLLFHFSIAYAVTIVFFLLYPRFDFLRRYPFITGVVTGIFTWIVTTRIVIPLSEIPSQSFHFWKAMKAMGILIVMIGLPLSYLFRWYYREKA